MDHSTLDAAEALRLAGVALALAALPLAAWLWRHRAAPSRARLAALAALTLFLTFDLVVFGAFTRLTDSGLGCPDWPGCYGEASPLAAHDEIHAAQQAQPSGPVTFAKAWIEMIHRYLAMAVGVLIIALLALAWRWRREHELPLAWPLLTLAWVLMQGLFGRYTVTLKLYPLVVTLHLLGGLGLLALLAVQVERLRESAPRAGAVAPAWLALGFGLLLVQVALGGWVSTNYAVLACRGFPTCNGEWWPPMDAGHGFTLLRELGRAGHGGFLPFEALVAIHMAHRGFAVVVLLVLATLARAGWSAPGSRGPARALAALLVLQVATGLSNVVLGWPIAAALLHSAGAAALVAVLATWLARARAEPRSQGAHTGPLAPAA